MECYNPFIPLDSKNSAIPAIIFNFTVTNTSSVPQDVTLMTAQQSNHDPSIYFLDFVGWDGYSEITGVNFGGYGGNVNSFGVTVPNSCFGTEIIFTAKFHNLLYSHAKQFSSWKFTS